MTNVVFVDVPDGCYLGQSGETVTLTLDTADAYDICLRLRSGSSFDWEDWELATRFAKACGYTREDFD
jgi:hypothetical protein